jgi:hypothetical protein
LPGPLADAAQFNDTATASMSDPLDTLSGI